MDNVAQFVRLLVPHKLMQRAAEADAADAARAAAAAAELESTGVYAFMMMPHNGRDDFGSTRVRSNHTWQAPPSRSLRVSRHVPCMRQHDSNSSPAGRDHRRRGRPAGAGSPTTWRNALSWRAHARRELTRMDRHFSARISSGIRPVFIPTFGNTAPKTMQDY